MFRHVLLMGLAAGSFAFATGCSSSQEKMDSDASMSASHTARGDIIDVATGPGMDRVTTLVAAVKAADLVDTLKGPGPFTVFAPTNEAFAKLPAGTVDNLLKPENKEQLRKILLFHVVPGRHDAAEVMGMTSAKTAEGGTVMISTANGKVRVGNNNGTATVIKTDVPASNGVIHWVDTVLMP